MDVKQLEFVLFIMLPSIAQFGFVGYCLSLERDKRNFVLILIPIHAFLFLCSYWAKGFLNESLIFALQGGSAVAIGTILISRVLAGMTRIDYEAIGKNRISDLLVKFERNQKLFKLVSLIMVAVGAIAAFVFYIVGKGNILIPEVLVIFLLFLMGAWLYFNAGRGYGALIIRLNENLSIKKKEARKKKKTK